MVSKIGTPGRDILRGTNAADRLSGLAGDDDLHGLAGNDLLIGGNGRDRLFGGAGHDLLSGGNGNDTLSGGLGNDKLFGGIGNDVLIAGGGSDFLNGGAGFDFASYADVVGGTGVSVDLTTGLGGRAAARDSYIAVEGVIGSAFDDDIRLAAGAVAFGGAGADHIVSTAGAEMHGGLGTDDLVGDSTMTFVDAFWCERHPTGDNFVFYDQGQDRLKLKGADFGFGSTFDANEFKNNPAGFGATGANPQFIYDQHNKILWFDEDGTGPIDVIVVAIFSFTAGPASLSLANFDLV